MSIKVSTNMLGKIIAYVDIIRIIMAYCAYASAFSAYAIIAWKA